MSQETATSIIKLKHTLMAGIRMAIRTQYDSVLQACRAHQLDHDRLYKMLDDNHESYSLSYLVDALERLGASLEVNIVVTQPRRISDQPPQPKRTLDDGRPKVMSWRRITNSLSHL